MVRLNRRTSQDFLNREWVAKLLAAGIDMSDAKYCIHGNGVHDPNGHFDVIDLVDDVEFDTADDPIRTYSFAELLYKLNEWPSIMKEDGETVGVPLEFVKDAPFYSFGYFFKRKDPSMEDITGSSEYPIEAAALLLIASVKSEFYNFKYVENVSDK